MSAPKKKLTGRQARGRVAAVTALGNVNILVSIPEWLQKDIDTLVDLHGYSSRNECLRALLTPVVQKRLKDEGYE